MVVIQLMVVIPGKIPGPAQCLLRMAGFTEWDIRLANRVSYEDIGRHEVKTSVCCLRGLPGETGGLLQDRHGLELGHQMADVQTAWQHVDT